MEGGVLPLRVKVIEVVKGKPKTSIIFDIIILYLTLGSEGDNVRTSIRCGVFLNTEYLKHLEGSEGTYISVATNHLD